jgi:hypothetical protein
VMKRTESAALERLRAICLALPDATERLSHGEPTWFVGSQKSVAMFDNHHYGHEHLGVWCAAPAGAQESLLMSAPARFYRPPYVGYRGWVGVYLDVAELDWDEVEFVIGQAYRTVAPARLAALVPGGRPPPT